MTKKDIIESIKKKFSGKVTKIFEKTKKRLYVNVPREEMPTLAKYVFSDLGARFNTASAIDIPGGFEILYHFTVDSLNFMISIKTFLEKKDPHVQSLTPLMKGAEWIEREIHELFGIEFDGHANIKKLLLPDEWPEDKYPLRRDFKL